MDIFYEKIKKSIISSSTPYILLLGFLGIFLLSVGELIPESKETKSVSINYYENYKAEMEKQIKAILSSVKGAGEVEVMITLESGRETIYVQQEKRVDDQELSTDNEESQQSTRNSYENEIVMIEENNQKQALVEKVLEPVVQGIVVVCSGADDVSVVSDITNAVCVALNITSNRVCVIKMK